jgi:signal transduction histidine kinase/CheY-like chemotaxis protein
MLKPSNLMSKCTVIVLLFLTANTVIGQNINQGQQPDALFTLQDSLTLFKSYNAAASEAIKNLNFDLAVRNISKANKLIASVNSLELKAKSILTNVQLQYHLQNYNQASRLNLDAIKIIHLSKDKSSLAIAYLMQGLIDTKLSNFAKAEKRFKMSDSIYKSKNDEKGKSYILLGRGMLELLRNKPQVAVNYLNAGITQFDEYDMKYQKACALLNKAEALLMLDDDIQNTYLKDAEKSLSEALQIINDNNYAYLKVDSYKISSEIATNLGNTKNAISDLNTYIKKTDSLNLIYVNAIAASVDEESSISQLKQTILDRENDLLEKENSENFNRVTNALSIAFIAILSLLTLSLYKNNNLRAKANGLLQDKNTELLLAKEKAEKASLAKAQFLSTITHELRTPLYAVTGLTHLLIEEDPKEHQKEHLNSLKFSGEYLLSLINNILDLNKLEANKVEIEKTSFDLEKRIKDVLIALKKSADDKKTLLKLEYDEDIPQKLLGDPLKLSQILINLIGNSVKFTQNGEVTVRIKKIDQKNKTVKLNFEIEDNGVGISKKKQKSIFETFSQGSLQINRKFGGTGLGLSIVKNLLELLNSKIHLESQLGKGSKFWFNLDIDISEGNISDSNNDINKTIVDFSALANKKVLVVEDNKINQMITKKILEKNKMICQVADNGLDAVKLAEQNEFDIILMDIHMPGISGIEATQKIREFSSQIPIIALTAVTIDENLDDFYKAGFNDIIPKPFKPEEFFEKIYNVIVKMPVDS